MDAAEMNLHLAGCRRCFDLFRDAAIYVGAATEETGEFESDPALVEDGLRIATAPSSRSGMVRRVGDFLAGPSALRPARYLAAAALITLVMISVLWFSQRGDLNRKIPAAIIDPVAEAVTEASRRGSFILPGGESGVGTGINVHRSGYIRINESLARSLRYLNKVYMGDDPPADTAAWLIAVYVATGQTDIARDLVSDVRKRDKGDIRIDNLEAIIALVDGDIERADSIFRGILTIHPDDAIAALNYSVLLSDSGRNVDALIILDSIIGDHPGTWMSKRASLIRETVNSR